MKRCKLYPIPLMQCGDKLVCSQKVSVVLCGTQVLARMVAGVGPLSLP